MYNNINNTYTYTYIIYIYIYIYLFIYLYIDSKRIQDTCFSATVLSQVYILYVHMQ